jgi:CubicO group peptidase (beta-lactamase class C family)
MADKSGAFWNTMRNAMLTRRHLFKFFGRTVLGGSSAHIASSWLNAAPPADTDAAWRTRVGNWEKRIPGLMEEFKVPGFAMVVIRNARIGWRHVFGVKDAGSKSPITHDTMFEAASMSKPVFAYAVMRLAQKGTIDLDTPLTKYTSKKFLEGDPRLDLITARRVLSHTTGFPNWRSDAEPLKISFPPGEKFSYSGEGISYLQSVVERLTAQPIEPFMERNLFEPFGMSSAGFAWSPRMDRLMARPHDSTGKPTSNYRATPEHVARYGAAGGICCTPTDYAKFLLEVIAPRRTDAYRLDSGHWKEMLRPQIDLSAPSSYPFKLAWSLGWEVFQTDQGDIVGHGGDNEGFHSFMAGSTERKSGFVVMNNGEGGYKLISKVQTDLIMSLL